MSNINSEAADKIKAALENLRSVLHEQLSIIEAGANPSESDIEKVVAERRQLAKSLELEKKLLDIWEELRFYPAFFKRDDWIDRRIFSIEEPQSEKKEKEEILTFKLFEKKYSLSAIEKDRGFMDYGDESGYPYELYLRSGEGKILLGINISRVHDEAGMHFVTGGLIGFVPGEWLEDYLAEYEKMAVLKEKSRKEFYDEMKKKRIEEMKKNFGLN